MGISAFLRIRIVEHNWGIVVAIGFHMSDEGMKPENKSKGRRDTLRHVDGYLIKKRVSTTASGQIYLARSEDSGQDVCLKWFPPSSPLSPTAIEKVVAGATACELLEHPNIVSIFEVTESEGRPLIISEWVHGDDLETIQTRKETIRPGASITYLRQVLSAFDFMFENGIIHGDARPRHLIMDKGKIRVLGFSQSAATKTASGITIGGQVAYTAPEIIHGHAPDFRTDIYAIACMFYEILVGKPPFGSTPEDAVLACHAHEPFPTTRTQCPHVPPALDALLRNMGSKDPGRRPESFHEILARAQFLSTPTASGHANHPVLIVELGRQRGMTVDIAVGDLLLGRSPGTGLVIDDGRISREHAMLSRRGMSLMLKDLNSRNGTKVNGLSVDFVSLEPGDRIFIGDTVLRVEGCESASPDALPMSLDTSVEASPRKAAPLGAFSISHNPSQQKKNLLETVEEKENALLGAVMDLAANFIQSLDMQHLDIASWAPLEGLFEAKHSLFLLLDAGEPKPPPKKVAAAEKFSLILSVLRHAAADQLAMATSASTEPNDGNHVVLAPVRRSESTYGYLLFFRDSKPYKELDLVRLERVAHLLEKRIESVAGEENQG
jgi:serine/threonine protein kinase